MHRLSVPGVIVSAAVLVGLAACAAKGPDGQPGGLETPSPVPITVNPSALPVGDTVPTGIVIGGKEMVLYFWGGSPDWPHLDHAWRDRRTGAVEVDQPCAGGYGFFADTMQTEPVRWLDVHQCVTPDGTLIEFGAVFAEPGRVTVQAAGKTVEAKYARWSANRSVTMFWEQRQGKPLPHNIPDGEGRTTPLPPEQYPLVTAYDGKGATIGTIRIRPSASEQKGG
ncbi:hypothetical protein ACFPIJ_30735 [Dactylosporangium cerinum]|uniref:Lipoprotein n=1 Tax=Dactylosporangium cerinum TaxID=1434730 RepID=A0ABV9W1H6_9ACTN